METTNSPYTAGSYFILEDSRKEYIISAMAAPLSQHDFIKDDTNKPILLFTLLDERFEKFKDIALLLLQNNGISSEGLYFKRYNLETGFQLLPPSKFLLYIRNEFSAYAKSKMLQPSVKVSVQKELENRQKEYSSYKQITDEIYPHDSCPLYISLVSQKACLEANRIMLEKPEIQETPFYLFDANKKCPNATDIYKHLLLNAYACKSGYSQIYIAMETKYINRDSHLLKNFVREFTYKMGLSQGPYIAFINNDIFHLHASNVVWFHGTPIQVKTELYAYQIERLFHELNKKYKIYVPDTSPKIAEHNLETITKTLKEYLSSQANPATNISSKNSLKRT